jgi:hypothetical protein
MRYTVLYDWSSAVQKTELTEFPDKPAQALCRARAQ